MSSRKGKKRSIIKHPSHGTTNELRAETTSPVSKRQDRSGPSGLQEVPTRTIGASSAMVPDTSTNERSNEPQDTTEVVSDRAASGAWKNSMGARIDSDDR